MDGIVIGVFLSNACFEEESGMGPLTPAPDSLSANCQN